METGTEHSSVNSESEIQIHDQVDSSFFSDKQSKEPEAAEEHHKSIISIPTNEIYYNSNHIHIGRAIVFNHENIDGQKPRYGTELDRKRIKKALRSLGFIVTVHDNFKFSKITDALKAVASEDHSDYDCLVVIAMTHGFDNKIYAKDMAYPVERLWNPFLGDSCKSLINKPKLFFVQACRGDKLETPTTYEDKFRVMSKGIDEHDSPQQTVTYAIPNTADLLVMYSTFEGKYSWRNPNLGSWFIQSLSQVLEEASTSEEELELLSLLTTVNRKVAYEYQSNHTDKNFNEMKEMPNFVSTLTKTFKFKPKN